MKDVRNFGDKLVAYGRKSVENLEHNELYLCSILTSCDEYAAELEQSSCLLAFNDMVPAESEPGAERALSARISSIKAMQPPKIDRKKTRNGNLIANGL